MQILTNNPLVLRHFPEARWIDGPPGEVLLAVRDAVHRGHRLLLHPFLGNISPKKAFFRSFIISSRSHGPAEPTSIRLVEQCLEALRGFGAPPSPPERETADFQTLDHDLLVAGLDRLPPSETIPRGDSAHALGSW